MTALVATSGVLLSCRTAAEAAPPSPPQAAAQRDSARAPALPGVASPDAPRTADRFIWGHPTTVSFLEVNPAEVGMSPDALAAVDSVLLAAVADGGVPGAALAVGRHGKLVRLRGYGRLDPADDRQASPATLYDVASLTKVVGTTTLAMLLEQEGKLGLDDPVVRYLPGWHRGDPRKAAVTVRQLLTHETGLGAFRPWYRNFRGISAFQTAMALEPLEADPGSRTLYSDLNAITLGWVVEAAGGGRLDSLLQARVLQPLGMDDTMFRPDSALLPRVAPTEVDTLWRHVHLRGRVHDENADAMGGVAGHAGLFSTAFDLAVFADLMLRGGVAPPCNPEVGGGIPCTRARADSLRLLAPETVARYTRRQHERSSRALGWDTPEGRSTAGDYFTANAYGHTGFTGTSIWIDPELDVYVVLLTNRVNPTRANQAHVQLRRDVHDAVALAITDRPVRRRESP